MKETEKMPICTRCKHARELARLAKVCASCPGGSSHYGKYVHLDAADDPALIMRHADKARIADERKSTASRVAVADEETADLLKRVVAEFATLTDFEAPLVVRRLRGQTNVEIAEGMNLSQAVVWDRWNGLKKRNPLWGAIDNGLIGRRGGRNAEKRGSGKGRKNGR